MRMGACLYPPTRDGARRGWGPGSRALATRTGTRSGPGPGVGGTARPRAGSGPARPGTTSGWGETRRAEVVPGSHWRLSRPAWGRGPGGAARRRSSGAARAARARGRRRAGCRGSGGGCAHQGAALVLRRCGAARAGSGGSGRREPLFVGASDRVPSLDRAGGPCAVPAVPGRAPRWRRGRARALYLVDAIQVRFGVSDSDPGCWAWWAGMSRPLRLA